VDDAEALIIPTRTTDAPQPHHSAPHRKTVLGPYPGDMRTPLDDEALATLAKQLAVFYLQQNDLDPDRGGLDQVLTMVVEHAMTYAFRLGYRKRQAEELS
jgi:hypothetical protein